MTVVAAYLYRGGQRVREIALDAPNPCGKVGEFVWIGLETPTEAELEAVQAHFDLHPLAIEDAATAHQLPKLEVYGDQLFIVVRTAALTGEDHIDYGETAIFVGGNHVLTVRHGSERAHTRLRKQLEAAPQMLARGVGYVLHGILDFVVDGYFPIVEAIEEDVLAIERRAATSFLTRDEINHLFSLRQELVRFQRILGPMSEVCSRLARLDLPTIDKDSRPYFRDVSDHLQRLQSQVDGLRDVVRSVFEISTLFEQQRQGTTTRQLAAWAAILAVPTAVAGIYGMNFRHMPELEWRYGYAGVVVGIAIACFLLYRRFKKSGWL